jgi:hypothetical protein
LTNVPLQKKQKVSNPYAKSTFSKPSLSKEAEERMARWENFQKTTREEGDATETDAIVPPPPPPH